MSLEKEHEQWIRDHLKRRKGERRDALKRGHGYGNRLFAERVWWRLVGHLHGLHPEYEVKDWRGRPYFVDFMWLVGALYIVFEIMDFGSHGTDRSKYRMDLNRGLYLQTQGYLVFYISLDELKENPDFILSSLRSALAPYFLSTNRGSTGHNRHSRMERELMRIAVRHDRILRPAEAAEELEIHPTTVVKHCRTLVEKGKFRAIAKGSSRRVTTYEYIGTVQSPDLF
ncbi:hypothetical protein E6C55_07880 [Cohnella fermenti]|uniref:DUF559 domain-containing protein n=2 Tax=Cohnella fermenti TaxID=2565925 RepID=A0A4S4C273_9BACL|nr:hypothetical protein E6C55_07880 [Cohnella fermenti]